MVELIAGVPISGLRWYRMTMDKHRTIAEASQMSHDEELRDWRERHGLDERGVARTLEWLKHYEKFTKRPKRKKAARPVKPGGTT